MKIFEKRKIEKYLNNLNTNDFPTGYLKTKTVEIETLNWISAYYDEMTASSPKELLEAYLRDINTMTPEKMREINVLYYWVYYKKIVGF